MVGLERRERGREFQMVGAEKEKDRRAARDLAKGTYKRSLSEERRLRVGMCGVSKVAR